MASSNKLREAEFYWCFISYRHKDNLDQDRDWASWLHREVERYEIPAEMVGQKNLRGDIIPERIYPVFRDEESLPANADLGNSIVSALDRSRFLVALCSPRSVASQYVEQEIAHFIHAGKGNRIIAAILAGEPGSGEEECFPVPLREIVAADGKVSEPIAADFRLKRGRQVREGYTSAEAYRLQLVREGNLSKKEIRKRAEAYENQLQLMKLKIIAGILGVRLEALRDRDKAYQLELERKRARNFRRVAGGMAILALAALAGGFFAWDQRDEAVAQKRMVQRELGRYWSIRADQSDSFPEKLVFAGKAIGYHGVGREEKGSSTRHFWDTQNPILLDPVLDKREFEKTASHFRKPFDQFFPPPILIWASPQTAHHGGNVSSVSFSPDGSKIVSGAADNTIKLWSSTKGKLLHTLEGHSAAVNCLAFSRDSSKIGSGAADKTIKIWDIEGTVIYTLEGHTDAVNSLDFSPDNSRIVSGSADKTVRLWDASNGELLRTTKSHSYSINSVAFSPNGSQIVSGSDDASISLSSLNFDRHRKLKVESPVLSVAFNLNGSKIVWGASDKSINLWSVTNGEFLFAIKDSQFPVHNVDFSPDSSVIVAGSVNTVNLWNAADGKLLRKLKKYSYPQSLRPGSSVSFRRLSDGKPVKRFTKYTNSVNATFSPDGKRIVSGAAKTVKLWNAEDGTPLSPSDGHVGAINSVSFSPDGSRIVSGSSDGTFKLWDAFAGTLLRTQSSHTDSVTSVAFSPDGTLIVSGSKDASVRLWDAVSGKFLRSFEGHSGSVNSVAFSPDGSRIVSGSADDTVRLWDAQDGKLLRSFEGHSGAVNSVAFSPDGSQILSGAQDHTVRLWNAGDGNLLFSFESHSSVVNGVAASPDGLRIVSGASDNTIRVWDATDGKLLYTLEGHSDDVSSVGFSPDGSRILSGARDHTIKLWDASRGALLHTLKGHPENVNSVAFSPDGFRFVSGSSDYTFKLWDAALNLPIDTLSGHLMAVNCVVFSPDGSQIVSGASDNTIKLWNGSSGRVLHTLEGHLDAVTCVSISADGSQIASSSRDRTIKLWDAVSGLLLHTFEGGSGSIESLAFNHDGSRIVSASSDRVIMQWDAANGKLLSKFTPDTPAYSNYLLSGYGLNTVTFNPDSSLIASASKEKSINLWDTSNGNLKKTLEGHSSNVLSLCFSPDGSRLASGSGDGTVKIWEVANGNLLHTLKGHHSLKGHWGYVLSVAFSANGNRVVSGSKDNTIEIWDASSGDLIQTLNNGDYGANSVAFSPDSSRIISASSGSIKLWDAKTTEVEDWLRPAKYDQEGWLEISSTNSLRWLPSDNLFRGSQNTFVNVSPDSLTFHLQKAVSEEERSDTLFSHYLDHELWKALWAVWQRPDIKQEPKVNRLIVPTALSAASPPTSGYPKGYFTDKFLMIWKQSGENLEAVSPIERFAFVRDVLGNATSDPELIAIANQWLVTLPEHLKQDLTIEVFSSLSKLAAFKNSSPQSSKEEFHLENIAETAKMRAVLKYNRLSRIFATSKEENTRNAKESLYLATLVNKFTEWKNAQFLDTLAAAYAASGQFEKAIEWQKKAIGVVKEEEKKSYQFRLRLYEEGESFDVSRDPFGQ